MRPQRKFIFYYLLFLLLGILLCQVLPGGAVTVIIIACIAALAFMACRGRF